MLQIFLSALFEPPQIEMKNQNVEGNIWLTMIALSARLSFDLL